MKTIKLIRVFVGVTVLCVFAGCNRFESEYDGLPHKGIKNISITSIKADTLTIDGSSISLDGKWILHKGRLYFIDYSLVGVREYDLDGNFIGRHISKGRGPNEWHVPFVTAIYTDDDELIGIDGSWVMQVYDSVYQRIGRPYKMLSDIRFEANDWNQLLHKPNVENTHMYEFSTDSRGMAILNDNLVVPIVTDHVNYNGYYISSNAKKFWRYSYTFLSIDTQLQKTGKKFGKYPPIYQTRNIPAFSTYSFDTHKDELYTSFTADPLIYVRDNQGVLLYSFGINASGVSSDYPETLSYEEFSQVFKDHLKKYSYYTGIKFADPYLFRTYKLANNNGYGIQIYKDENLIGEINVEQKIEILGVHDNLYYGLLPVDLENERFKIIKFSL